MLQAHPAVLGITGQGDSTLLTCRAALHARETFWGGVGYLRRGLDTTLAGRLGLSRGGAWVPGWHVDLRLALFSVTRRRQALWSGWSPSFSWVVVESSGRMPVL